MCCLIHLLLFCFYVRLFALYIAFNVITSLWNDVALHFCFYLALGLALHCVHLAWKMQLFNFIVQLMSFWIFLLGCLPVFEHNCTFTRSTLPYQQHSTPILTLYCLNRYPYWNWSETTQGRNDPGPKRLTYLGRPKRPTLKIGRNDQGWNDPGPKRPRFFDYKQQNRLPTSSRTSTN